MAVTQRPTIGLTHARIRKSEGELSDGNPSLQDRLDGGALPLDARLQVDKGAILSQAGREISDRLGERAHDTAVTSASHSVDHTVTKPSTY